MLGCHKNRKRGDTSSGDNQELPHFGGNPLPVLAMGQEVKRKLPNVTQIFFFYYTQNEKKMLLILL